VGPCVPQHHSHASQLSHASHFFSPFTPFDWPTRPLVLPARHSLLVAPRSALPAPRPTSPSVSSPGRSSIRCCQRDRRPSRWYRAVFEGTESFPGNVQSLQAMAKACKNPTVHFFAVTGATHFSALAPANQLIASKVLRDDGPATNLAFTEEELSQLIPR